MKHFLALLFLVTNFLALHGANNDLDKSKHTVQETIVSLFPAPAQSGVYPDTDVEIVFSIGLDEKQVKPNTMRLRQIDGKKLNVKGTISYLANEKRLRFIPTGFLEPGMYELDVMAIKATKEFQQKQIKNITYRFSVANVHPLSLKVKPSPIEVKEGTSVDLKTAVVYDDGSEQTVEGSVAWKSGNTSIFIIDANATATGLKEGQTTVSSSYKGVTSETAQVLVYLEIGGHRLPPEPDPAINNSTLLGIDSNNNGVRDDVERWIYQTYKNEHPIHIDIAMQAGRAWQMILANSAKSIETSQLLHAAQGCEAYYKIYAKYFNEPILIHENIVTRIFRKKVTNTELRKDTYFQYDKSLSGNTYSTPNVGEEKKLCDFDTNKYENN